MSVSPGFRSASAELRAKVLKNFACYVIGSPHGFGKAIGDRMAVTELAYCLKTSQAVGGCELTVTQDMLNSRDHSIHDGCTAYLMDMGTALPYILLGQAEAGVEPPLTKPKFSMASFAPSHRLEITFLNPAPLGTRIRLIAKTVANAGRSLLVAGELWDLDRDRMIAYATHYKIMPKKPPQVALKFKL
ncbi:hypothetical protein M422DRAFT_23314 [Sphaerobolus stellatus SS14]|nr:hypothetical protein M422DRAFT_23314 [Sphaerobolus stellatus SS14]